MDGRGFVAEMGGYSPISAKWQQALGVQGGFRRWGAVAPLQGCTLHPLGKRERRTRPLLERCTLHRGGMSMVERDAFGPGSGGIVPGQTASRRRAMGWPAPAGA